VRELQPQSKTERKLHPVALLTQKFKREEALTNRSGVLWLFHQAEQIGPDGLVIEVGTWCGYTAAALALGGPKTICVDTFMMSDSFVRNDKMGKVMRKDGREGTLDRHALNLIELGLGERVATIQALSVDAARAMGRKIADLIYLDADHEYEAVIADFLAWEPVLKPGGIMCGDNYNSVKDVGHALRHILPDKFPAWPQAERIADDCWFTRKPTEE